MEREGEAGMPLGRGAEVLLLLLLATAVMERAGEGVNINRGVEVPPSEDVRTYSQISAYTGGEAAHLNGDPDPNTEPGAEGAPWSSSITQGVGCANAGRDQRDDLAGTNAPAEERECDRVDVDVDERDRATRSTLGTCP